MKRKLQNERKAPQGRVILLAILTFLQLNSIGQVESQIKSKICKHKLSLSQLSSNVNVSDVKISCLGNTRIVLAKAPQGFSTSSQYPFWVVWSAGNQAFMPHGNPISSEFELLMEPQYKEVHSLEVEWISSQGTICTKSLDINCQGSSFSTSKSSKKEKRFSENVTTVDGMLNFKDSETLFRFYQSLLSSCPVNGPMPKVVLDSLGNSIQRRFTGFRPLHYAFKSKDWQAEPILTFLLNHQQAVRVGGVLYAFNGPHYLYAIPPGDDQNAQLKQLIESRYKILTRINAFDLLANEKPANEMSTRIHSNSVENACDQLFIFPND